MPSNILKKISREFKKYEILEVESGASKKKFYKLVNKNNSFIIIDFVLDKREFENHLKIYNLLKDIDISIPKIIEKNDRDLVLITENFGNLRFDKILQNYDIKNLLSYAVDTLVILKKSIRFDKQFNLLQYNFDIFKNEIIELPHYYFPYINLNEEKLDKEFLFVWSKTFNKFAFEFDNFVHKDFNLNNLIFIPSNKKHLKCGVIDFQNAFWGESSWDLFSLLEDSRILFTDEFNEYFIEYFFKKTNQCMSLKEFKIKFYFLNLSRQTRLLGRWIKLSKELDNNCYLDFIPVTLKRLKKSLILLNDINLTKFYNKYILTYEL